MKEENVFPANIHRIITIIFKEIIVQIDELILYKTYNRKEDNDHLREIQISISDKLIYLMDILEPSLSPSSSLYALYTLWLNNIRYLKNLPKVQEDMYAILKSYKIDRRVK